MYYPEIRLIRYERKHSDSLWHTDYHELNNPSLERKQLIPYEELARVKHPQTNSKMERFFGTIERLLPYFDNNIDKAIAYYNFRRPHMSLVKDGKLLRP